ncbi:MAG: Uma2 family endonuclease [Blastocatellia bacterium]
MAVATQQIKAREFLPSIKSLLPGGTLIYQDVGWEEYECLLEDMGAGYSARISYDHGKLEIHMPLPIHDYMKICLSDLIRATADELEVDLNGFGSTTFKYKDWLQGLEPDACYYLSNDPRVLGVRRFDPNVPPPPPDIAIEVDITSESLSRFHIYQRLGVPEIWRCDERQFQFYHLTESGYVESSASHAFPLLTGQVLLQFLERCIADGQSMALREFRQWMKTQLT